MQEFFKHILTISVARRGLTNPFYILQKCNLFLYRGNKIGAFLQLLLLHSCLGFSQGQINYSSTTKSIIGALELVPNSTLAEGFQRVPTPFKYGDPALSSKVWLGKEEAQMRGIVKDAVLFFEWWTLLGDPIERYKFKWVSSGFFEVRYAENGRNIIQSIYRQDLIKYPDLLKWFDSLAPENVNMEIHYSNGNLSDEDYYAFRNKYNILEDLGSAGYKFDYITKMNGANWLFESSGKDPALVVPQISGWGNFLGINADVSPEKRKRVIELFKLSNGANISSFQITSINWDIESMVRLAKTFNKYEKGELSPIQQTENAKSISRSTGADNFWNEPDIAITAMEIYRDPTNNKYGLKSKHGKSALPATYYELKQGANGFFFAKKDYNSIYVLNSQGKEVAFLNENWNHIKENLISKFAESSEKNDCNLYYFILYDVFEFSNGTFEKRPQWYSIEKKKVITVRDNNYRPSAAEEAENKERRKREDQKCVDSLQKICEDRGAILKRD